MNNLVAFTKKLLSEGYTQKQIGIIIDKHQSWIQRIAAKTTYNYVSMNDYSFDSKLEIKKFTLDTFLAAPEIVGGGHLSDQDIAYIKILKYCGVHYNKVRDIYFDRSRAELRTTWDTIGRKSVPIFNGTVLGLKQEIIQEMFGPIFD